MPKATPSKRDLPKKPTKPKLMKNEEINATRLKEYNEQLIVYDNAIAEHSRAQLDRKVLHQRKRRREDLESEGLVACGAEAALTPALPQTSPKINIFIF